MVEFVAFLPLSLSLFDSNYQFLCRLFPYTNFSPLKLSTRRSIPLRPSAMLRVIQAGAQGSQYFPSSHARVVRIETMPIFASDDRKSSFFLDSRESAGFALYSTVRTSRLRILPAHGCKERSRMERESHAALLFFFRVRLRNQSRVSGHTSGVFRRGHRGSLKYRCLASVVCLRVTLQRVDRYIGESGLRHVVRQCRVRKRR